jgi:superkiller protein 3
VRPRLRGHIALSAALLLAAGTAGAQNADGEEPSEASRAHEPPRVAPPASAPATPPTRPPGPPPLIDENAPMTAARARLELYQGQRLLAEGLGAQAAEHFQRVLAAAPDHPGARLMLAQALSAQGRPVEAAEEAQRAADLVAALPPARRAAAGEARYQLTLGLARAAVAQLEEAEAALRHAAELAPLDAEAWHELGVVLLRRGSDADAAEALARATALVPDRADSHAQHGNALLRLGRLDEARAELERAVTLAPESADAWYALASVHRAAGRDDDQAKALAEFERLRARQEDLRARDGAVDSKLREAVAASAEKRDADAIAALESALADPRVATEGYRRSMVLSRLARALAATGELARAEELYARALEDDPTSFTTSFELGTLLARSGRDLEAMPHLLQAVTSEPFTASAHVNLGLAWAQLGRLNEALAEITKATTLDPDDMAVRQLYVNLLWAIGERTRAGALAGASGLLSPEDEASRRPPEQEWRR